MAKRLLDWGVKGTVLVMAEYFDKDTPSNELEKFDIALLYPDFAKYTEVQQYYIVYGIKQKLADKGSDDKTVAGKRALAIEFWNDTLEGKIRTKATGGVAKENKTIANNAREMAKVVSLEGLMAKKIAFPDQFTEENEKKLQEFFVMVAEHSKNNQKSLKK